MVTEQEIYRCASLLCFMDTEAALELAAKSMPREDAFLAIIAAEILSKDLASEE